ncbi:MAG: hypothetical protein ACJ8HJ_26370 [Massilia sp.]
MSTAIYSHPDCSLHEMGDWHPETPARLQAIEDQLILARLDGLVERRDGPPAGTEAILRNHSQGALDVHGLERVAIVDFDVHHGNGTAESFRDDPRVLMASFFQHPFYPYTEPEPITATSINVPVAAYTGGDVVRKLVAEQWLPALHAFRPQMIFISAGFDAHREDDMGGMALVEADYAWITHQVADIARRYAGGRIVSCLEGGYALSALGRSVVAHVKALAELD